MNLRIDLLHCPVAT